MKRIVTFFLFVFFATVAGAQTITVNGEEVTLNKEQKKQLKAKKDSLSFEKAFAAMEANSFVLECDQLELQQGRPRQVSSATNFVSLNGDEAVIQVAPVNGGGPNGVGGITVDGKASDITLTKDKKGNVIFKMNVFGAGVSATVDIHLYKGGNEALVNVSPNFHSNRVTLRGEVVPFGQARVFEGSSRF